MGSVTVRRAVYLAGTYRSVGRRWPWGRFLPDLLHNSVSMVRPDRWQAWRSGTTRKSEQDHLCHTDTPLVWGNAPPPYWIVFYVEKSGFVTGNAWDSNPKNIFRKFLTYSTAETRPLNCCSLEKICKYWENKLLTIVCSLVGHGEF